MNIKSIILAAGKGSRMRSDLPKVMHTIGGMAMFHHVVSTCKSLGEGSLIGVVGHHAEVVINSLPNEEITWVILLNASNNVHPKRLDLSGFQPVSNCGN